MPDTRGIMRSIAAIVGGPMWTAFWVPIGAIVTVLVALYGGPNVSHAPGELAIVKAYGFVPERDLPREFVGKETPTGFNLDGLRSAIYFVINKGPATITPVSFWEPITVRSKTGTLVLVLPCEKGLTVGNRHVEMAWNTQTSVLQADNEWIVSTTGLNVGDVGCFKVFLQQDGPASLFVDLVEVSARLKGVTLTTYESLNDLPWQSSWSIDQVFSVSVLLEGQQVYFFVVLQGLIFFLTFQLTAKAGFLVGGHGRTGLLLTAAALLSASSAQNLITLQILDLKWVHPALWLTLLAHIVLFAWLAFRIRARSRVNNTEA